MAVTGFESQFSFYIQLEITMKHKSLRGTIYEAGMSQYMGVDLKSLVVTDSGEEYLHQSVTMVADWISSQPGIKMLVSTYDSTYPKGPYIHVVVYVDDNDTAYSAEYASTDEDIKNVLKALGV